MFAFGIRQMRAFGLNTCFSVLLQTFSVLRGSYSEVALEQFPQVCRSQTDCLCNGCSAHAGLAFQQMQSLCEPDGIDVAREGLPFCMCVQQFVERMPRYPEAVDNILPLKVQVCVEFF